MAGSEERSRAAGEGRTACAALRDLQDAAAALAKPVEPDAVARHLLELACRFAEAPAGVVSVATGPGRFEIRADRGLPPESVDPYRSIDLESAEPPLPSLLRGDELFLESAAAIRSRFPEWSDFPDRTGAGAWAFVPIRSGDRPLGTLSLFWPGDRTVDGVRRSFLRTLAQQGGFALDRARLLAEQRRLLGEAEAAAARERQLAEERSRLLERLADAKVTVDALFDAAPNGIAFVDKDLRLRRLNAALAALAGRPREALLGAPLGAFLGAEHGPELDGVAARVLATGAPELDRELALGDGDDQRHFVASLYRLDADGRTLGIGAIVRDVTQLRRAEEFRKHLLAIVGHDLRSPLAAIDVSAQALQRRLPPASTEAITLGRIRSSAARIERMIRALLDWARSQSGQRLPLSLRESSIEEVCHGAAAEAMAAAPGRQVLVEGSGDPRGYWDPERLGQALGNLVNNALKHGRPDRPVRVRWRTTAAEVELEVENQGEPIPAELRDRLFEPFRRGATTAGPGGGLGLGLYIARELVRAHGGGIALRSDRAATVFTLRLPRRAAG